MKSLILVALTLMPLFSWAKANSTCIEAKEGTSYHQKLLFLGSNHWLATVGYRLIEIQDDKLKASLANPERLQIMCGVNNSVIATTLDKLFKWENGKLTRLFLKFPGYISGSDGKVVYSTESTAEGHVLYVTKNGISRKIVEQHELSGAMHQGQFTWGNYDTQSIWIFKNGVIVKKLKLPEAARFESVLDDENCKGQGLFDTNYDFYTQSRFGIQTRHIEGPIIKIDYSKGCHEYVFLLNDFSYAKGALWSLKPGKQLTFTTIPTSCPVDHFASNNDGSLYYRCGKQFYYKDKVRTKDVLLGEASNLRLTAGVTDRWMATENDGTLFMFLPESKQGEVQRACVVRLTPKKLVDLGCF